MALAHFLLASYEYDDDEHSLTQAPSNVPAFRPNSLVIADAGTRLDDVCRLLPPKRNEIKGGGPDYTPFRLYRLVIQ